MPEPAKIRNVGVVGHRGTGKTSLVEALLFQTGGHGKCGRYDERGRPRLAAHKRLLSIERPWKTARYVREGGNSTQKL